MALIDYMQESSEMFEESMKTADDFRKKKADEKKEKRSDYANALHRERQLEDNDKDDGMNALVASNIVHAHKRATTGKGYNPGKASDIHASNKVASRLNKESTIEFI